MNAQRRKAINLVMNSIMDFRADIETIRDEEQEYFDNMPDNIQMSEKGEKAEEVVSNLDEAMNCFDEIENYLTTAAE